MPASTEYNQVMRVIAALRGIGLAWDANTFEETVGDGLHIIDFKERDPSAVSVELSTLYSAIRETWNGVENADTFIDRDLHRRYSVKFIDSAVASFQCRFKDGALIKQRASYYQSPFFRSYSDEDLYKVLDHVSEVDLEEYWGLFGHKIPCLRDNISFRYDFDPKAFKLKIHPRAHFHLGEAENCRICLESPPDIRSFFRFIVSKFYAEKLSEFEDFLSDWDGYTRFPYSIHEEEHAHPFFSWGKIT